jgi:hypothetical protein
MSAYVVAASGIFLKELQPKPEKNVVIIKSEYFVFMFVSYYF